MSDIVVKVVVENSVSQRKFLSEHGLSFFIEANGKKILFDCGQARKIVDIVQRDMWIVLIGIPSVLIWQVRISPGWLLPLVLAGIPGICLAVALGPSVGKWSLFRLESMEAISGAIRRNEPDELKDSQKAFYRSSVWFEVCKKAAETFGDLRAFPDTSAVIFYTVAA